MTWVSSITSILLFSPIVHSAPRSRAFSFCIKASERLYQGLHIFVSSIKPVFRFSLSNVAQHSFVEAGNLQGRSAVLDMQRAAPTPISVWPPKCPALDRYFETMRKDFSTGRGRGGGMSSPNKQVKELSIKMWCQDGLERRLVPPHRTKREGDGTVRTALGISRQSPRHGALLKARIVASDWMAQFGLDNATEGERRRRTATLMPSSGLITLRQPSANPPPTPGGTSWRLKHRPPSSPLS